MISVLGSEIGRGHPFYLDGTLRALRRAGRDHWITRQSDVFRISRGVSRAAWDLVHTLYRVAGKGGPVAALYGRLRKDSDYNRDSPLLKLLGADLRAWTAAPGIVLVDHPAVVGALGGRADVWYVHGEMIAPPEAIVRRATRIFVPTEETAGDFMRGGMSPQRLVVTGICIENELVPTALEGIEARRGRIAGAGPLTVAFFSSGAEPPRHVEALVAAATALGREGKHRAWVFARRHGRLLVALEEAGGGAIPPGVEVRTFHDRSSLDQVTASAFGEIDCVVSPPHERSNWAAALATPFFLVGPDIGPFAPRNRDLLLRRGVAAELGLEQARDFSTWLDDLRREGLLQRMSNLSGGVPYRGFERIAEVLAAECERRAGGGG